MSGSTQPDSICALDLFLRSLSNQDPQTHWDQLLLPVCYRNY